ncbi:MAG TPA: hypothetical protein VG796_23820 [Verrucomicrobiales bacterium]|nr:hypothetical protein [Verrucomicrobiales bacterium]
MLFVSETLLFTPQRDALFIKATTAFDALAKAGVPRIWIAGSFLNLSVVNPSDIDGAWECSRQVNLKELPAALRDFSDHRNAMRSRFGVDLLLYNPARGDGHDNPVLSYYGVTKNGDLSGILEISL